MIASTEAKDRLLAAWRGEIQARAQYEILAQRMKDPRRADVIRQIAEAEGRHRERIEKRLLELGVTIPDPATVQLSWMQRMQARLAPVPRVMARISSNAPMGRPPGLAAVFNISGGTAEMSTAIATRFVPWRPI